MGFTSATDDMLYLFGGWNSKNTYGDLYRFNPTTTTWFKIEDTGNAPSPRVHFGFAATGGSTLVVFGGYGYDSGAYEICVKNQCLVPTKVKFDKRWLNQVLSCRTFKYVELRVTIVYLDIVGPGKYSSCTTTKRICCSAGRNFVSSRWIRER